MREDLRARCAQELVAFRSAWEDATARPELVDCVLPRIAATLDLLPPATSSSRLLELGSAPFIASQCLAVVWPGEVTHANYFGGDGERRGAQTLVEIGGTRRITYEYDVFNVEADEFPYPDASFDVVVFAELIEHLAVNPVWALAEMHRVLKPGGHLVVTTPNALSLERLDSVLTGRRPVVDQYSPLFGYGARHNREYSAYELRLLLEETGFDVETLLARDFAVFGWPERLRRALLRALARPFSRDSRREHLLLRARRRPAFRWRFPPALFTSTHLYRCVRHPWVEMGLNDTIQCEGAWEPLEPLPDGGWCRRVRGVEAKYPGGTAELRGVGGRSRLLVRLCGDAGEGDARVTITVAPRDALDQAMAFVGTTAPCGRWVDVDVPLSRPTREREPLLVNVAVQPGRTVAVRRIALA